MRLARYLAPLLLLLFAVCLVEAAESPPPGTEADFAIQGEYVGDVTGDDGKMTWGAQIIALGKGKFHAVGYPGGLPGAGWDQKEKKEADGELADGKAKFTTSGGSVLLVADGVMTVLNPQGSRIGELKKVERRSPTLGAKPPEGAVVLFDGASAETFDGGRMTDDGLLMQGATSKQKFGSHTVHVEFLLPFMPEARGQGRGNSGIYLQGRYEVQMLDSFGLEGKNNECGGIYEIADPKVNMCLPPLTWQTFDIEFTAAEYDGDKKVNNARMTVRHNGVLIHDDVELPRATRANRVPEGPQPGPVYLQDHGNPVRYRNIWVLEKE